MGAEDSRTDSQLRVDAARQRPWVGRLDPECFRPQFRRELLRRPAGHQMALVDDGQPIAPRGLVHGVRGQEEGDSFFPPNAIHQIPESKSRSRIEAGCRFIEEQYRRGMEKAAEEVHTPFQPSRKLSDAVALSTFKLQER